jgi:hypothetical protein
VSYTASNGTTIKITKELGTIDRNTDDQNVDLELEGYPQLDNSTTTQFSETIPLETVQINAIGYKTP